MMPLIGDVWFMKRIVSLAAVSALCLGLIGCNSNKPGPPPAGGAGGNGPMGAGGPSGVMGTNGPTGGGANGGR